MSKVLVTSYINPYVDGTACALAYAGLLKSQGRDAEAVLFGSLQPEADFFAKRLAVHIPVKPVTGIGDWSEFVVVDNNTLDRMPKVVLPDKVIEVIDHRELSAKNDFPKAKIQDELVGAAATLIVERFVTLRKLPSNDQALLLYGGIFHNTLNFLATTVDERDRAAVCFLEANFQISPTVIPEMFAFAQNEVAKNISGAIAADAKRFELTAGLKIAGYQLVLWDPKTAEISSNIQKALTDLDSESGVAWSVLNVVSLKNKRSLLFASSPQAQGILMRVFNCQFINDWAVLDTALLRKQIIGKLNSSLFDTTTRK